MVQVRRAHDEPGAVDAHADRHVSRGHIGRRSSSTRAVRGHAGLVAPAPQHLAEPNNVANFAAFGRHLNLNLILVFLGSVFQFGFVLLSLCELFERGERGSGESKGARVLRFIEGRFGKCPWLLEIITS